MYPRLARVLPVLGIIGCGDNLADPSGPRTVIDAPPEALSSRSHVEVAFHAVGAAAGFTCSLDDAEPAACASPWTFDAADGAHRIEIAAIGAGGAAGPPATASFTVDTIPPDTVITVGPGAVETTANASFTFAASPAEARATFECAVDGESFKACTSPAAVAGLAEGAHTFHVRAIDAAGNVDPTPAMLAWSIDTMGPQLLLLQTPPDPSNAVTPTFRFSSTDASATFECQIDGVAAFAPCASPYTAPALADGPQTFRVRAIDSAHNQTAASYAWTVDTVPPTVAITGGPSGATSTAAPVFDFTASADAALVECAVDAAAFAPCTSPVTISTLAEGAHAFTVRATDAAGNAASATRAFTVDTVQPTVTITSGPSGPINDARPTWTFTTTDAPTLIECALDGGAPAPCVGTFTPAVNLADGAHAFTVHVADAAGNQGTDARAIDVDTVAPIIAITGGPTGTTLDTTPTFTFSIMGAFTASRCWIDIAAFTPCSGTFTSSPLGGGPHVFEVQADDAAGNTGRATRPFDVDADAPTIFITVAPGAATNDATPTFQFVAGPTASTVDCRIDGGAFAPCTSPFTVSPALAEGAHTFEVQACTIAPVCAGDSSTFTVDVTPPDLAITAGPQDPTPTAAKGPTFAFTATGATGTTCRITDAASPNPPFVPCTASFTPSGQLADSAHTFEVVATDDAGNSAQRTRAFTVDTGAPVIAIQPPSIPARTSDQHPTVFFTVTDPSAVATTCSVDGGAAVPCDGAAGFAAPSNLAEGTHAYQVTATDAAGNPGAATITFIVDITPATVTITSGPVNPTNDDTPSFAFTTSPDATRARCTMDTGEVIDPCTSGVTFPAIAPGARTFTVTVFDDALPANTASAAYPFVLGFCGDNAAQGTEQCDGGDLRLQTCVGLGAGYTGGTLGCTAACTYDTSSCATCGNGIVEPGEECDGGQLGGASCSSLGFDSGTLRCDSSCRLDTRQCFEAANLGFAGKVCFDGVQYPAPGNGNYVVAATEDSGVFRSTWDPAPIWSNVDGTGTPTQIVNNLHGRAVVPQPDGPAVTYLADNSTANNAFRSNNITQAAPTWTQFSFTSGGMQTEMFSARPGSSTSNILGGWHPTLGAVVLHGMFPGLTTSAVGAGVTGTVRSIATGAFSATTDVYAAVYGQTPTGGPATGGIFWTCDQVGAAGGLYTERDTGLTPGDKQLVWSLTVDPVSFTSGSRTCPTTGGSVSGYANTYYATLRGGGQVYKTVDGGQSWAPSNTGLPPGAEVYKIALDCFTTASPVGCPGCRCVDHNLLYAATNVGLYKSTDAGAAWALVGLGGKVVRAVTLQKEHPVGTLPRIFVGVDDAAGIYQANAP